MTYYNPDKPEEELDRSSLEEGDTVLQLVDGEKVETTVKSVKNPEKSGVVIVTRG